MSGMESNRNRWRVVLAALLIGVAGIGTAIAGPEEDYAAGMVSYKRVDYFTAMPLLRKAADAGHAEAAAVLASILDIAEQDEEAVKYYRKSAEAGNLNGIYGLAGMLSTGEGGKKDFVEARALFAKAGSAGHKPSIHAMAQAYILGELGLSDDERKGPEAVKWITLAADTGWLRALETLEQAYRTGGYGLEVNLAKADEFKQKVALLKPAAPKKRRRGGDAK